MDVRILTQGPHAILRAERETAAKMFSFDEITSKRLHTQYRNQRKQARDRGVLFDLSYLDWLNIWLASGKLAERGVKPEQYCMSRKNDTGGYSKDNVRIIQCRENSRLGARKQVMYIPASSELSPDRSDTTWKTIAQAFGQRLDELIEPLLKLRETLKEYELGNHS